MSAPPPPPAACAAAVEAPPEWPAARSCDAARRGVYVHVTVCARRCSYCDFSTGAISPAAVERYLAAMEREVRRRAPAAAAVEFSSVFFGGGTPSALAPAAFRRLWTGVRGAFRLQDGAEITLEANPESVEPARLEAWAGAGVNRLSMGAQSFDPAELGVLERVHAADRPARAMAQARAFGFERLSLDLMFGFPGSSRDRLAATLDRALELAPEHLSAYCFIPEPGTPLGDAVERGAVELPGPDEQADAYGGLVERLGAAGYGCYETSNFCRPGAEARHNLVYWLRRPYLGLGPSAHGLWEGARYGNSYAFGRWAAALEAGEGPEDEIESETGESVAREVMMLGLRLGDGLRARDHAQDAWSQVVTRYGPSLERALALGRLERHREGLRIPPALRFVADDVIAWIDADARPARVDSRASAFLTSGSCPNLRSQAA